MDVFEALVTVLVFFALTPGVLLTLPLGNKYVVALAHGAVFFTVLYFLNGATSFIITVSLFTVYEKTSMKGHDHLRLVINGF